MHKVAIVATPKQKLDRRLRQNPKQVVTRPSHFTYDPHSSLRLGDVVRIARLGPQHMYRGRSERVRYVVTELLTPWGVQGRGERAPVWSEVEWRRAWAQKTGVGLEGQGERKTRRERKRERGMEWRRVREGVSRALEEDEGSVGREMVQGSVRGRTSVEDAKERDVVDGMKELKV